MLVLRENVRHVGNQLGLIADQWIVAFVFSGCGNAQAAEHNGTAAQRHFAQIRNLHVAFERAHAPGAVFAHHKFQMIASRSQQEAGVVLHVLAANLLAAVHGKFDRVAQMAHRELAALQHFSNDVQRRAVLVFLLNERNLRARHQQRYRQEIMRVIAAEIRGACVHGDIGRGKIGRQLVLNLLLAVGVIRMFKIAARVVARAVFKLDVRTIQSHLDVAEPAVFRMIRTGIAQNVVRRSIFLHLRKNAAEIVRIEERLPAGVRRQRRKRFLRRGIAVQIIQHGCATIRRLSMQAGILRFASSGKRLQPAHVERIDRDVGLYRSRRRCTQRGLIVHARLRNSIAEINQALFLRQLADSLND